MQAEYRTKVVGDQGSSVVTISIESLTKGQAVSVQHLSNPITFSIELSAAFGGVEVEVDVVTVSELAKSTSKRQGSPARKLQQVNADMQMNTSISGTSVHA